MYDKTPYLQVTHQDCDCIKGWPAIAAQIRSALPTGSGLVCVECYPGVLIEQVSSCLRKELGPHRQLRAEDWYFSPEQINDLIEPYLSNDPVFGRMNSLEIWDFIDPQKIESARTELASSAEGITIVIGTGASLLSPVFDVCIYADMARWEIQQRQRRNEIGNLGAMNFEERPPLKYKRSFFIDWRAADRLKIRFLPKADFLLDTNVPAVPKMITRENFEKGLTAAVRQPFRVVPFFDPGPWGGHWMEEVFDLPRDQTNYAWCFDCVPEENSLLLRFGRNTIEIPALDLVLFRPEELLGKEVVSRFGAEFPIRFDLLDTFEGGNLSLQVHPGKEYIQREFGMNYTQDESYYILDSKQNGGVYLGLKTDINRENMIHDLRDAQENDSFKFEATRYVNQFPARKHDHFLIPAGTVHCSGKDTVVLEISATPYIFTFKLWDWGRVGLDGQPRPIHLDHGIENICWDRTTKWVEQSLMNRCQTVAETDDWREELTGLHPAQFIETRRHWFTSTVPHDTNGNLNVLNLVQGSEAVVESPTEEFSPFVVHYAETFIVPAAVGRYTIRPAVPGTLCATIKAFVRPVSASDREKFSQTPANI
ncbi:mannose-6-phosphate isomerase [Edaphobacter acidisoli]|uniref:Mannose-6-phosphate isomerase n=1 Tax=Edaphobacter acidisoli TaxID=2040573 RepID=A0A916RU03_9BACT|nr:class I mannose-6-phosphate isomerase [Edaphobacter acidisoli]GGA67265.1 mannose-6-phosphate isomerase [Edaphobacter acidisoli]